jgi:hypothetical protein
MTGVGIGHTGGNQGTWNQNQGPRQQVGYHYDRFVNAHEAALLAGTFKEKVKMSQEFVFSGVPGGNLSAVAFQFDAAAFDYQQVGGQHIFTPKMPGIHRITFQDSVRQELYRLDLDVRP